MKVYDGFRRGNGIQRYQERFSLDWQRMIVIGAVGVGEKWKYFREVVLTSEYSTWKVGIELIRQDYE